MNPWRGLGGMPREVWVLAATTFVNRSGTMVVPFLALYVTRGLGFTPGRAGLLLAVYGIAAFASSPVMGRLADRVGAVPVMLGSLLATGAAFLAYPLARGYPALLGATALLAVVNEAFRPASMAFVSDATSPGDRKAAFSVQRLAVNLGMSFGPALGGFLAQASFVWLFLVDGATSLAAGLALASFGLARARRRSVGPAAPPPTPGRGEGRTLGPEPVPSALDDPPLPSVPGREAPSFLRSLLPSVGLLRDRRLALFLVGMFFIDVVFFQHMVAMPLFFVSDLGLPEGIYGAMFTINTLLIVLFEVPLNLAMSRVSHRRALGWGAVLCTVGYGLLAIVTGLRGAVLTTVVWTFGEMVLFPGMSAYVAEVAPPGRSGEAMGFFNMTFGLAFSVGPWIGAFAYERIGHRLVWLGALALGAVALAIFSRLPGPETPGRPVAPALASH